MDQARLIKTMLISEKGMSLIDVLVSIWVVALLSMSICTMVVVSRSANTQAQNSQIAVNAARRELDLLRGMKCYLLPNQTNGPLIKNIPEISNLSNGTGRLTVADCAGLTGLKQVAVTISWTAQPSGRSKTYTITTMMGQNGLRP